MVVGAGSQATELRDDVAADGLEVGRVVVVGEAEDDVLGAGIGEVAEVVDDLAAHSRPRLMFWSVERSISSGSRPTAAQWSARIAYLRAMPSGGRRR